MKPGRHAVTDASFVKSAGGAGARGLVLLAVALLIGVVLLNATDADPPGSTVSAKGDSDTSSGTSKSGADGEGKATPSTTAPVVTTTTLPARAPKDVKVIVANASPTKGAAGTASAQLKPLGYNVLAPSNAAAVPESSVFFVPGFDRDAAAIAAALKLPPTSVKPVPAPPPFELNTANVAIVLGATDATRFAPGGAPATTVAPAAGATTTAKPAAGGATTTTAKPAAGGATTTSTAPAATSTTKKP